MYKYFRGIKNVEDLKATYKKLVFELHPDRGGNSEKFIEMKNEFDKLYQVLKNTHKQEKNSTDEKKSYYKEENIEDFKEMIEKLQAIIKPNMEITVEFCGSWVWVYGNTYAIKEELKGIGFMWQKATKKWYNPMCENFVRRKKKAISEEKRREKYGYSTKNIRGNLALA